MSRVRLAAVLVLIALATSPLPPVRMAAVVHAQAEAARIPLAEFKKLLDQGKVVVLDVRGAAPYAEGHIPGAVSVPLETVGTRAAEYAKVGKAIVTYCA